MTDDNSPGLGGQHPRSGDEPGLSSEWAEWHRQREIRRADMEKIIDRMHRANIRHGKLTSTGLELAMYLDERGRP